MRELKITTYYLPNKETLQLNMKLLNKRNVTTNKEQRKYKKII